MELGLKGLNGPGNLKIHTRTSPPIRGSPPPITPCLARIKYCRLSLNLSSFSTSIWKRTLQNQQQLLNNHLIQSIQRDFQLLSSSASQDGPLPIKARLLNSQLSKSRKRLMFNWIAIIMFHHVKCQCTSGHKHHLQVFSIFGCIRIDAV